MRLWSLHPSLLDVKGIVALWREALLAQKVLQGKTKGYKNHPQLNRFKAHSNPLAAIATYLAAVQEEATRRGYSFDIKKVGKPRTSAKIKVSRGQIVYEFKHLKKKLKQRDPFVYKHLKSRNRATTHPLFRIVRGKIESWERRI